MFISTDETAVKLWNAVETMEDRKQFLRKRCGFNSGKTNRSEKAEESVQKIGKLINKIKAENELLKKNEEKVKKATVIYTEQENCCKLWCQLVATIFYEMGESIKEKAGNIFGKRKEKK
jgi:hypothetical protein